MLVMKRWLVVSPLCVRRMLCAVMIPCSSRQLSKISPSTFFSRSSGSRHSKVFLIGRCELTSRYRVTESFFALKMVTASAGFCSATAGPS
jgi:hypothetical protein